MQVRTMARRVATVGAVGLPLALAATGMASASEDHSGQGGHCTGGVATQDGGLLGLDAAVNPAVTVGSVLGGPTSQQVLQADRSNSGIVQSGWTGIRPARSTAPIWCGARLPWSGVRPDVRRRTDSTRRASSRGLNGLVT